MVRDTPFTTCIVAGTLILILLMAFAGCITVGDDHAAPVTPTTSVPGRQGASGPARTPTPVTTAALTPAVTQGAAIVMETEPVASAPPVNLAHRAAPEENTSLRDTRELTTVYSQMYPGMKAGSHALLVNITDAPWAVGFSVTPRFENPWDSFLVVTVRDADTMQIVAQDGFGRLYSSEKDKEIRMYAPGRYHVNMEGAWIDLAVTIRTAGSPASVPVPTWTQKLQPTRPPGMPVEQWIALQKGR